MTVRAKGNKDLMGKVLSQLKKTRPRDEECTYEVVRTGGQLLSKVKYLLTSGIEVFDHCTGGLPFGRVVEVFGLEGCGKTAMVMRCCARAGQGFIFEKVEVEGVVTWQQVKNPEVAILYIDNEQSLDDDRLVVDGQEIDAMIGRCETVDQLFKMIDVTLDTIEEAQKESDNPCFIVVAVDTIASTSSKQEKDAEWGELDYARQPQQLSQGFRKIIRKLTRLNVLMIATNQVRDSFAKKQKYGNSFLPQASDFSTFGGRALRFYSSVRVFMYAQNTNYKLNKKSVGGPSGFLAGFVVVKNRQVKPFRQGKLVLLYDRGLSHIYSVLETLAHLKLIDKTETGVYAFRFDAAGIKVTTFPDSERGNPRLNNLLEWPGFYETHKADMNALWEKGKALVFANDEISADVSDGEDDADAELVAETDTD